MDTKLKFRTDEERNLWQNYVDRVLSGHHQVTSSLAGYAINVADKLIEARRERGGG